MNPTTFCTLWFGITWCSFRSMKSPPQSLSLIWTIRLAFASLGTSKDERQSAATSSSSLSMRTTRLRCPTWTRTSITLSENRHVLKPYLSHMQIVRGNVKCSCMGQKLFMNSPWWPQVGGNGNNIDSCIIAWHCSHKTWHETGPKVIYCSRDRYNRCGKCKII